MQYFFIIQEAIIISIGISGDIFAVSLDYSVKRTPLPLSFILIFNTVCSILMAILMYFSNLTAEYITYKTAKIIGAVILMIIGFAKLFEEVMGIIFKKAAAKKGPIQLSDYSITVRPSPLTSKKISPISFKEWAALALALSADALAASVKEGLDGMFSGIIFIILSFIWAMIGWFLGKILGNKLQTSKYPISLFTGLLIIMTAAFNLFF